MTVFGNFFTNYIQIFHKTEVQTVILRCLGCLYHHWIKSYNLICVTISFFLCLKRHHFGVFCWSEFWHLRTKSALIFFKWLIQRHNIPHFKGRGMRILQYEIRICQKMYDTGTMLEDIYYLFKWNGCYIHTYRPRCNTT